MEIISERHTVEDVYFTFDYEYGNGSGFTFPCDSTGKVLTSELTDAALENLHYCEQNLDKFSDAGLVKHVRRYTLPAKGKCKCGNIVELVDEYLGACECEKCGQWYNIFGQALVNPEYWEEDVEEVTW